MSIFGTLTNSIMGSNTNSGAQGAIQNQLAHNQQAWNISQQNAMMNAYPYVAGGYRTLHLVVKQVENGYTVEIGGSTHIASDLKEITDLLTNRVAATLLEWNP
jgi:hypothetical protein